MKLATGSRSRRVRAGVVIAALALVAAACQPGWTDPLVGSGDGSGTTPGSSGVAKTEVALAKPTSVVAIPGGGFYVYDVDACAIYKQSNDGKTSLYAGTPGTCVNSGDGGPATEAALLSAAGANGQANVLALGPDGTLYFATDFDEGGAGLRVIHPDGTITSTIGTGLMMSMGVTVSSDGTVYMSIAAMGNGAIVRLEPDGSWTTVYTSPSTAVSTLVAVTPTQLVFADSNRNGSTVTLQRLDLTTDTTTPLNVSLANEEDSIAIAGAPDGTIYLGGSSVDTYPGSVVVNGVPYTNQVVRLNPDGTVTPIAGTGTPDPGTTRQSGAGLELNLSPTGLAVTPNHGLLISSGHVVYRLDRPALAAGTAIPSTTVPPTTSTTVPAN